MNVKKFSLQAPYELSTEQVTTVQNIIHNLNNNCPQQTLMGVTGSGKTFTMANIIHKLNRPALILAHNKTLAAQLYSEMRSFFPKNAVEYFVSYYDYYQPEAYIASSDTYISKDSAINDQIEQMRLSATKSLLERKDVVIVASVSAIYGLGDPELYMKMILPLRVGDQMTNKKISKQLSQMQYRRLTTHIERGCFKIQGDVIDIFPAESETKAIRIETFDNCIECIYFFDPLTGEKIQNTHSVTIFPKTQYSTPQDVLDAAIDKIKAELKERLSFLRNNNKLLEAQRLEERTKFDLEMIQEMGYCNGIENYSCYFSNRKPEDGPATLIDYLPKNSLIFADESHMTLPQVRGMHKADRSRKLNLIEHGFRLPSAIYNRPLMFEEFEKRIPQAIFVSATPGPYESKAELPITEQLIRPTGLLDPQIEIKPVKHQIDDLYEQIQQTVQKNQRILVTTLTKKMAENLCSYLDEKNVKVRYLHSDIDSIERVEIIRLLRLGQCDVLIGINLLREGLDMPEVSLVAILDADKEGFLRSYQALIQTIGRAARNVNGRVILYADKITPSIEKAVSETNRRREKQHAYNEKNGITPQSIQKNIIELIPNLTDDTHEKSPLKTPMSQKQMFTQIRKIEKQMQQQAGLLNFEKAAQLRDEMKLLKQALIKLG